MQTGSGDDKNDPCKHERRTKGKEREKGPVKRLWSEKSLCRNFGEWVEEASPGLLCNWGGCAQIDDEQIQCRGEEAERRVAPGGVLPGLETWNM